MNKIEWAGFVYSPFRGKEIDSEAHTVESVKPK